MERAEVQGLVLTTGASARDWVLVMELYAVSALKVVVISIVVLALLASRVSTALAFVSPLQPAYCKMSNVERLTMGAT